MLGGDATTEEPSSPTKGSERFESAREILSACEPVSRGNADPADLIGTRPPPAAGPPAEASDGEMEQPRWDLQRGPACLRCGLAAPDHHRPDPVTRGPSRLQASSWSVPSSSSSRSSRRSSRRRSRRSSRSRGSISGSHLAAATPSDSCSHLVLACLSCRCSSPLPGLTEACSSGLEALFCCCCCRAAPAEEPGCCPADCHSLLLECRCCEAAECLEFCLECCEICHRS